MKTRLILIFVLLLISSVLSGNPGQNGQCEGNGPGVSVLDYGDDVETLQIGWRSVKPNFHFSSGYKPPTYRKFFTSSIRSIFNQFNINRQLANVKKMIKNMRKKEEEEEEKAYEKLTGGKDYQYITGTNGCLKDDMYYCYFRCDTNFGECNTKDKYILYVPNRLHQELCIQPRLKKGIVEVIKFLRMKKCLASPCNCKKFKSYFINTFPDIYKDKIHQFKQDCHQTCTTNVTPPSLKSICYAKKKFAPMIQIYYNFAKSLTIKRW